ncbi:hypothetical protein D9H67_10990 [Escherichia coli]|nr:hypothetical protein [Escherichia coli]
MHSVQTLTTSANPGMLALLGYPSFGFAENTDDLFVGKTLLHGDVLMWLMKTLLTSGCTNQRGAGHNAPK